MPQCRYTDFFIKESNLRRRGFRFVPGARFLKFPETFRARKAICEVANRLFWKADLLTCFQGTKKKINCEV